MALFVLYNLIFYYLQKKTVRRQSACNESKTPERVGVFNQFYFNIFLFKKQ